MKAARQNTPPECVTGLWLIERHTKRWASTKVGHSVQTSLHNSSQHSDVSILDTLHVASLRTGRARGSPRPWDWEKSHEVGHSIGSLVRCGAVSLWPAAYRAREAARKGYRENPSLRDWPVHSRRRRYWHLRAVELGLDRSALHHSRRLVCPYRGPSRRWRASRLGRESVASAHGAPCCRPYPTCRRTCDALCGSRARSGHHCMVVVAGIWHRTSLCHST